VWREGRTTDWGEPRLALLPIDLRLMHYIFQRRKASDVELTDHFGSRSVRCSLERLLDAGLVRSSGRSWLPCAFERAFAATKIIAIEAKIGNWSYVLSQARLNTWFASRSYVLVPRASQAQIEEAQQLGIGVLSPERGKIREQAAASGPLPRSYASWIVNDVAWRASKSRSSR
jgi:hypothetical protein